MVIAQVIHLKNNMNEKFNLFILYATAVSFIGWIILVSIKSFIF